MKIGVPGLSPVAAALLYSALPAGQDRVHMRFENIIEKSGINFVLANSDTADHHQVETMIDGVAVFDYVSMKTAIS